MTLGSLLLCLNFQVPSMVTCSDTVLCLCDVHTPGAFSSVARVTFLSPLNPTYIFLTSGGYVGLTQKSLTVTLLSCQASRTLPVIFATPGPGNPKNPSNCTIVGAGVLAFKKNGVTVMFHFGP